MVELVRSLLAFIVVIGVLVTVHELGHYLAARWNGVGVEVFSIGFGRALHSWTDRRGTVWKLAWLPLGGYVKMYGMERTTKAGLAQDWDASRAYHTRTPLARASIIAAGPIANFLLAILIYATVLMIVGRPVSEPVIGEVIAASAADHAGLRTGDRVAAIDGIPITTFEQLRTIVGTHADRPLQVTLQRDGAEKTLRVTPEAQGEGEARRGVLGIRSGQAHYQPVSLLEALKGGITQSWEVGRETLQGVGQVITGARSFNELGGPVKIAELSGQVAVLGVLTMLWFIAQLSISLGLINLFPIPVLDGGHLLFIGAEAVRGRPLPARAQEYSYRAGFALLLCLFAFKTVNDIVHLAFVQSLLNRS